MAGTATAAKAAGTVAAGGGPEDPVTDAIAIGEVATAAGKAKKKAPAKDPATGKPSGGDGGEKSSDDGEKSSGSKKKASGSKEKASSPGLKTPGWTWTSSRKLLVSEFVVCAVVLGAGTILAPEGSKHDVERAMVKGSALALVFFILALVSSAGTTPARVANALGTLVTASYVLTSADVHHVVAWLAAFFQQPEAGAAIGSAL